MERIKALLEALEPWDAVVATICTGLFTIAGVLITTIYNARADKRRIAAESARAEIEDRREHDRLQREDQVRAETIERALQDADSAVGGEIVTLILTEQQQVRVDSETFNDKEFAQHFTEHWKLQRDLELRELIAKVRNDTGRADLLDVADAIMDFAGLAGLDDVPKILRASRLKYAYSMLGLAFELAAALQRGQAPMDDINQQLTTLRSRTKKLEEKRQAQRNEQLHELVERVGKTRLRDIPDRGAEE
ncbi:MAG: hypothetical protein ACK5LO_09885 [Leucobacter sp.]